MVAAGRADTVIVLHPEKSSQEVSEASKAAVAMALTVAGECTPAPWGPLHGRAKQPR